MKTETLNPDLDIMSFVGPRSTRSSSRRAVRKIMRENRSLRIAYAGGTPAELQSRKVSYIAQRAKVRAAFLARLGRPIDIRSMLKCRNERNEPTWALVDPTKPVGSANGKHDTDGTIAWPFLNGEVGEVVWFRYMQPVPGRLPRAFEPSGIPPIPGTVRRTLAKILKAKRTARVGILYQPETWEVRPDPALVVEWKDRLGEFFALAVWGGDRAQIMEWVE